jgi:hypothetical protein
MELNWGRRLERSLDALNYFGTSLIKMKIPEHRYGA